MTLWPDVAKVGFYETQENQHKYLASEDQEAAELGQLVSWFKENTLSSRASSCTCFSRLFFPLYLSAIHCWFPLSGHSFTTKL